MARPKKVFPDYPGKPHSSGQAVIWLDGRAVYLGKFGSPESRQKYERLRAERHYQQTTGTVPVTPQDRQTITVAEVLARYLDHADQHYQRDGKPTKQRERLTATAKLLSRQWGDRPAVEIDPPVFDALLTYLCGPQPCRCQSARTGANRRGPARTGAKVCGYCHGTGTRKLSRLYIRHLTGCVKQIFDWAAFHKLIPPHSLRTVRAVRRGTRGVHESPGVRSVPRATVQATVAHAGPIVRDLIEIQYLTGARPEEAIGLTRERINTDGVLPEVGSFPGVWVYAVADEWNKNAWRGQGRVIFFGPHAQAILTPYLSRTGYLFSPLEAMRQWLAEAGRAENLCHDRQPGEHYSTQSYGRAIKRACRRARVPHWTPLQLRHLRGTEIRSQYDMDHARVVLGHHAAGVTSVYCEPDLFKAAKVAREIG